MRRACWMLLLLGYTTWLAAAEPTELSWCLDDHWHHYNANNKQQDSSFRFMQTLAERLDVSIQPSDVTPFSRCLQQIRNGDSDLMVSLNFSEERHQYMHLLPYDTAHPEIIFVRINGDDIHHWQELVSKPLAVLNNYQYSSELQQKLQQQDLHLVDTAELEHAFALLLLQEVEAVLAPAQSANNVIRNNPRFHQQFKASSYQIDITNPRYIHLAFSRQSHHQDLVPLLQQILQQMMDSGEVVQFRKNSSTD